MSIRDYYKTHKILTCYTQCILVLLVLFTVNEMCLATEWLAFLIKTDVLMQNACSLFL